MSAFKIKNGLIIDNGGISVTGSISSTAGITGSFSGSIAGFPTDVSSFSSSLSTRITSTEATASQYVAASGSLAARIASNEAKTGSFATTGSNYFIGQQVITGSVYISSDLIVQGSSSLQNITASAVSIGTNTVILNTDSPAVRFAGISVRDSGSNSGVTSSIWYDSLNNKWIYQNESGSSYSGGMFISGPRNTGSLGDEASMTNGYIAKGLGGDHIGPSIIYETGSSIGIGTTSMSYGNVTIKSNGTLSYFGLNVVANENNNFIALNHTGTAGIIETEFSTGGGHTPLAFVTNGTERMRITTSGSIGIGITNPSTVLHIQSSVPTIRLANSSAGSGAGSIQFYSGSTQIWNLGTHTNNDMYLYNSVLGGYNYWIQNSTGNVGIGITSPGVKLHIVGGSDNTLAIDNDGSTYTSAFWRNNNSNRAQIYFQNSAKEFGIGTLDSSGYIAFQTAVAQERMRLTSGGNLGINLTVPTQKLSIRGNQVFTNQDVDGVTNALIAEISSQARGYSNQGANMASIQFRTNSTTWYRGEIAFITNNSDGTNPNSSVLESMRITSEGNVLLTSGTTVYNASGDFYLRAGTSGTLILGAGGTNGYMRISDVGSVSIGMTSSPYGRVAIKSNNTTAYMGLNVWANGNGNFTYMNHNNNLGIIGTEFGTGGTGHTPLTFQVGGTERLRIGTDGRLSITMDQSANNQFLNFVGTQSSFNQEYGFGIVNGTKDFRFYDYSAGKERYRITNAGDIIYGVTAAFDTSIYWRQDFTSTIIARLWADGNPRFNVQVNGSGGVYVSAGGTSWTAASDERLKTDLLPIENGIDKVNQLRSVTGRYLTDDESKSRSFLIAQDVYSVLPEAVDVDTKTGMMGVQYTEVIPLLVASIKELSAKVAALEAQQ